MLKEHQPRYCVLRNLFFSAAMVSIIAWFTCLFSTEFWIIILELASVAHFSKIPKSFRTWKTAANPMITELCYLHILNMNRGSLHTRSFMCMHLSAFGYWLSKNGFAGPKNFRMFWETGPCSRFPLWLLAVTPSSALIKNKLRQTLRKYIPHK